MKTELNINKSPEAGVFRKAAAFYDLIYGDKDYAAEAEYLRCKIQTHHPRAKRILELGCGTGAHAKYLATSGYDICGVDFSSDMISVAKERQEKLKDASAHSIRFLQDDIRTLRLKERFDVVVSLFHVVSYMVSNEDVDAAFATAKAHLNPGGLFLFDCWYGPAVLNQKPEPRIKKIEDQNFKIIRSIVPDLHINENTVDLNYHFEVFEKERLLKQEFNEMHRMRYFFMPELLEYLKKNSFELLACEEWMTERVPGVETWGVCFTARLL